jgi:hypothetical protein
VFGCEGSMNGWEERGWDDDDVLLLLCGLFWRRDETINFWPMIFCTATSSKRIYFHVASMISRSPCKYGLKFKASMYIYECKLKFGLTDDINMLESAFSYNNVAI